MSVQLLQQKDGPTTIRGRNIWMLALTAKAHNSAHCANCTLKVRDWRCEGSTKGR
jgi:hypothetical protein